MKILIADDEKLVRYSLVSILENLNIDELEIVEAVNGRDFIEKVEEFQPDGGFVDIRMPGLSGLDALTELKRERPELYSNTTWFILTGFADFEFARKAITVDVKNYLLKPVSAEEIRASMETIEGNIKEKLSEKRKKREAMLVRLANQNIEFGNVPEFAGFSFHRVTLLTGDSFHEAEELYERNRYIRTVFDTLPDRQVMYTLFFLNNEHTVFFMESAVERDSFDDNLLSFIKNKLMESIWLPVTMLITGIYPDIHAAVNDFSRLESMLRNRHFIKAGDVRVLQSDILQNIPETGLGRFIDDLYAACYIKRKELIDRVVLSKPSIEVNRSNKELLIENLKKLFAVPAESNTLDELIAEIVEKYRYSSGEQKLPPIVQRTVRIINERFHEAIGINEIAEMLSVSPNYLSSLFKKEMNISFTRYLTEKRLEISRKLLLEDGSTVKKAAQKVGYTSEKHFSRLFKKYYSISPSTFKLKNSG